MGKPLAVRAVTVALGVLLSSGLAAAQVVELQGAWLIDGYTFQPGDRSPRGTIAYDGEANSFAGTYVGLKLPAERPELHAWLYDTPEQKGHAHRARRLQAGHPRQGQGGVQAFPGG